MVARAAEYSSFPLDPNPSIQVSRRGGGRPESVSSMSPNVTNRALTEADFPTVSLLHAKVFGPGRFTRTAYRVREGAAPISPFCRVALLGDRLIAAVRFTPITIGGANGGLLLGPLAVDPDFAGQGFGKRLIAEALEAAKAADVKLVVSGRR